MTFHIISLFPNAFRSYLGKSIVKRAIEDKKIKVRFYNPRDFARNKYARVDRRAYGGGPGMVVQAEPVIRAVARACSNVLPPTHKATDGHRKNNRTTKKKAPKIIWLSPRGKQFTNTAAIGYAKKYTDLIIICGRYEGIDARVKKVFRVEEVSVGPFVLTGGELAAEIIIDTVARQVPEVLGDPDSREEARAASPDVYTRPRVFAYKGKKYRVPAILLSGHHANIEKWRAKKVVKHTPLP